MKGFKKVKSAGAAGLAALMLTIGAVGMTANASAVLPNPDTCPHSWTAEEYAGSVCVRTEEHIHNDGTKCTIKYMQDFYNIRCRSCGTIVKTVGRGTKEVHEQH